MTETTAETATQVFVENRERLFAIVYNMLGSVADTEDVLQETWLSWTPKAGPEIANPAAYLVRIAVNHALNRQAAMSRRRETYIGPWLPDPLLTEPASGTDTADVADTVVHTESVSMAMLIVLETLTPLERAVFVLGEVFGYPYADIADMLGRATPAVRQIAHRARQHVHARRPKYQADPRIRRELTERFLAAQVEGDLAALLDLLTADVTLWTDGGGKVKAALRPIHGRDTVIRLLAALPAKRGIPLDDIRIRSINGDPAALLFAADALWAVIVLKIDPSQNKISGIYAVNNPDKLAHLADA